MKCSSISLSVQFHHHHHHHHHFAITLCLLMNEPNSKTPKNVAITNQNNSIVCYNEIKENILKTILAIRTTSLVVVPPR